MNIIMARNLICRICVCIKSDLKHIFIHDENISNIATILRKFASIEVNENDGLPSVICLNCFEKLSLAYDLQNQILESDQKLRKELYELKIEEDCKSIIDNDSDCQIVYEQNESFSFQNTINQYPHSKKEEINLFAKPYNNILNQSSFMSSINKPLVCNICNKHFTVSWMLQLHERIHAGIDKVPDSCTVDTKEMIKQDTQLIKLEEMIFCEKCNKNFLDHFSYIDHLNNRAKCKLFICSICDENFATNKMLQLHIRVHKRVDNKLNSRSSNECALVNVTTVDKRKVIRKDKKKMFCDECNKGFYKRYDFIAHTSTHTGYKPFVCEICKKGFAMNWKLRLHKRVHTGFKPYTCEVCNKKFTFASVFANHKLIHTGERPYKCDQCDKAFVQIAGLKSHQRTHTGEKPYLCEICSKTFGDFATLTGHLQTHSGKKDHSCPTCGKQFLQSSYVKRHMKTHTDDKPHVCEICNKRFLVISSLKTHKRIHDGSKPYSCKVCGKLFRQSSCIPRHMRTHSGETPYPCTLCPKKFAYSHHLLLHIKKYHST